MERKDNLRSLNKAVAVETELSYKLSPVSLAYFNTLNILKSLISLYKRYILVTLASLATEIPFSDSVLSSSLSKNISEDISNITSTGIQAIKSIANQVER